MPTPSEQQFIDKMISEGWEVFSSGYPDFVCLKDGKSILVEVKKDDNDFLRNNQLDMLNILTTTAPEAFIWNPEVNYLTPLEDYKILMQHKSPDKAYRGEHLKSQIIPTIDVVLTKLSCKRCGHSWIPRHSEPPAVCPFCKSRVWMKVKRNHSK